MTENVENIMLTKGNVGDKRTQHKSKYMAGGKVGGGIIFLGRPPFGLKIRWELGPTVPLP